VQWAIEHQIKVGRYFGADDFVPVAQAHIMADNRVARRRRRRMAGALAALPAQPAARANSDHQPIRAEPILPPPTSSSTSPWMLELERRAITAFEALGVLMNGHLASTIRPSCRRCAASIAPMATPAW